ncbi:hypothetical protein HID58_035242 [Brassica napus]|uniref:Uncharacterized protein n=1 Tax=Brassica napus TaxID=3708 RepID=A0ABQ8C4F0_BRANA|nr:hypothetical protein HID58_035242 [Brassica napus]
MISAHASGKSQVALIEIAKLVNEEEVTKSETKDPPRSSRNFSIYLTKGSHSPSLRQWFGRILYLILKELSPRAEVRCPYCLSSEILTLMLGIDSSAE